jgi:Chaperone of endosialidase
MAYTITKSNGNNITIADNTIDSTYAVQLVGKNRTNYGTAINQNFFRLMESFANSSSPANPQTGQLWWDTGTGVLKVYNAASTNWKPLSGIIVSNTAPTNPVTGDQWYDTANQMLKIYDGTIWVAINASADTGATNGFVTESFTVSSITYYVATMYVHGERVAIVSKDTIVGLNVDGFTNLVPGINYRPTLSGVATSNGNITGNVASFSSVGVGVSSPLFSLHTVGTIAADQGSNQYITLGVNPAGSASPTTYAGMWYDATNHALRIEALSGGVSWRNLILQGQGGANVGIGTVTPGASLHVLANNASADREIARFQGGTDSGNYRTFVSLYGTNPSFWWELSVQDGSGTGLLNGLAFRQRNGSGASVEKVYIDSTGKVGIGTTSPNAALDVNGDLAITGANRYIYAATTNNNLLVRSNGTGGLYLQHDSTTGNLDVFSGLFVVTSAGNVGIGTTVPAYQLQLISDSAAKPSTNTWTIASDSRIKTVIGEYSKGLAEICALKPVTYRYNGLGGFVDDGEHVSVIAQEAQTVFPECVGTYKAKLNPTDTTETDLFNWNGHAVTFALINAVKELRSLITQQQQQIQQLMHHNQ